MAVSARLVSIAAVCLLLTDGRRLAAAPSPEQIRQLKAANDAIGRAGAAFKAGNFKESGENVKQAQGLVEELKNDPKLARQLEPILGRLQKAHALLEIEGVALPPLNLASKSDSKSQAKKKAEVQTTRPAKRAASAGISFVKNVAPILIAKCGRCHVNQARGGLSMASFASLERGNRSGKVIVPGKADGSRIIEVIESGDMPRGGLKVSQEELATLKTWIAEGAKFDAGNPMEPLTALVPNAQAAAPPRLEVRVATGEESVQFSRDIAQIIVKNCFDCHGPGRQDGGQLSLETFAGILRGGQSGLAITPGEPADSLIVKKLRGTAGARMPLRRDALAASDIAAVEKWIAEGAKYDGGDPNQSLELVAAITRAKSASHEQLAADRAALAQKYWRLALPDVQPDQRETVNFLLLGNIGEEPLEELGRLAEQQAAAVAKMLRSAPDQPIVKGRITLFAFKRRPDYSEWRNVESREIPAVQRGHWKYNVVDAYACIVPPTGSENSLAPLLAQQIAAIHMASLGRVPNWFADGAGRVMASRSDSRDAQVREWEAQAADALGTRWNPVDFLAGKLPPQQQEPLNFALVKALAANPQKYQSLLSGLRQSGDFDQAFARAYGVTPQNALAAWGGHRESPSKSPAVRRR